MNVRTAALALAILSTALPARGGTLLPPAISVVAVVAQNQQPENPDRTAPDNRDRQTGADNDQPVGTAGERQEMPTGTAILAWVILAAIAIGGGLWYTTRRMTRTRTTDNRPPR